MKRLLLYITEGHASVTVDATVSRQTSAADVPAMLAGMPDDDRAVLERFCETVLMLRPSVTVDTRRQDATTPPPRAALRPFQW